MDNHLKSKKKATNKDVARLAGVSVATVSYVVNGKIDKRIPERTKQKVLQAIHFLNYTPNPYAVGLSANQAQNIIVRTPANASFLQDIETMYFLQDFNKIMGGKEFYLSYVPDKAPKKLSAAACVCVNMSKTEFYALSNENFIPLIILDSFINDPIFYQINLNYQKIKRLADSYFGEDYTYVSLLLNDTVLREQIQHIFPNTIFVSALDEVLHLKPKNKNVLITNNCLKTILHSYQNDFNVFSFDVDSSERFQTIYDCIVNAMNRVETEDQKHFIEI